MQITKSNAEALFEPQVINEIIEGATKKSVVLSTFRALPRMTSNKTKMRVLDSLPMAYWVDADTDNGRKKLTKMAWDNKWITAEELAVIVPIKEDVLDDASYDIWAEVRPRIEEAFAKKIDSAVITGVDKPRNFRADLLSSIRNAGANIPNDGSETFYSLINDAMVKVEESGYNPNAILGGVGLKGKFRMMLDTTGQPIQGTEIGQISKYYMDNGVWDNALSLGIVGDFSQAVYAIRQDVTYKVLDQAVIQDPVTGEILYNLAQEDMVALRITFRLGWQLPNPINALQEDEGIRFPFASIEPAGAVPTTQTVTFSVTDAESAVVKDAKVTFGGNSKKTDAQGKASFKAIKGDYNYVVKKEGHKDVTGSQKVEGSAVNIAITNF